MNPENNHDYPYRRHGHPAGATPGQSHDALPPPLRSGHADQPAPPIHSPEGSDAANFPALGATLPTYSSGGPMLSAGRAAQSGRPQSGKPKKNWKKRIKRAVIILLVIALLAGGYVGVKLLINAGKTFSGGLFGLVQNDKLKGEDVGRVNILLAGNSADDAGHSGGDLTDSIMLISLDTKNNTAFVMSIPRDLWVSVPGDGYAKINSVYVDGKAENFSESGYPTGGMGELEKVVERDFDVDINYYALVNYTALRDAVNAVGGIDVNIQSSDPRGLYDPSRDYTGPYGTPLVKLTNGVHTLNGQQALNLARARGDTYGSYGYGQADFIRTANQRLMLTALKDKATSAGVASNPIKLGSLLDSIGNNVLTDFQTSEVRRLVSISQKIPSSSIKSVSLNDVDGKNLLKSYTSYNGQSALIPATGVDDFSAIDAYLKQLMTPPATTTSGSSSSSSQ